MFAITGITGKVGERRPQITGRPSGRPGRRTRCTKSDAWVKRGCEAAVADIGDAQALARAFLGAEGVFILIPPIFDPSRSFRRSGQSSLRSKLHCSWPCPQGGHPVHYWCAGA